MVPVAAVVDQPDLAVKPLELRVRKAELHRRQDPASVGPDGPRELHERGEAGAAGPRQPPVQMQPGVLGPAEPVEVPKGLLELPTPVEHRPVPVQRVQDTQLGIAEVIRVLEQRPAGALDEPGTVRRRGRSPRRPAGGPLRLGVGCSFKVPPPPPGPVDGLVGELHDVEGVNALDGVGDLLARRNLVGAAQVERDRLELGLSLLSEFVVEGPQCLGLLALCGPDHRAVPVVVGDDREVAMPLSVGDLVDPDAVELIETGVVDLLRDHSGDDVRDRLPRDAKQPGDGGLVDPLSQERDDVFQVTRLPGSRTRPGDLLGADPFAPGAGEPSDLALDHEPARAEVEMAPAADRGVVGGPRPVSAAAGEPLEAPPEGHDYAGGGEAHRGHGGAWYGQHLVECGADAHVSPLPGKGRFAVEAPNLPRERHVRVFRVLSRSVLNNRTAWSVDAAAPQHAAKRPTRTRGVPETGAYIRAASNESASLRYAPSAPSGAPALRSGP